MTRCPRDWYISIITRTKNAVLSSVFRCHLKQHEKGFIEQLKYPTISLTHMNTTSLSVVTYSYNVHGLMVLLQQ